MTKFLAKETAALTAQPWQDAQGNVHLPIDQAMKVVANAPSGARRRAALPNYPGAAQQYSYPRAPMLTAQTARAGHGEAEIPPQPSRRGSNRDSFAGNKMMLGTRTIRKQWR